MYSAASTSELDCHAVDSYRDLPVNRVVMYSWVYDEADIPFCSIMLLCCRGPLSSGSLRQLRSKAAIAFRLLDHPLCRQREPRSKHFHLDRRVETPPRATRDLLLRPFERKRDRCWDSGTGDFSIIGSRILHGLAGSIGARVEIGIVCIWFLLS